MGEVIGTTIQTTPVPGATAPVPEVKVERPTWLPEKFKTEADLVKSYSELEKKLSQITAANKPKDTPKVVLPSDTPSTDVPGVNPDKAEMTPEVTANAEAAIKKAGLELKDLQKEYDANNGELTPETKARLADVGIGDAEIEVYKNGLKANGEAFEAAVVKGIRGGKEALTEAIDWAVKELDSGRLTQDEVDAFNSAMESGKPALGALAAEGLVSKFRRSQGPVLIDGTTPSERAPGYESRAQQLADMKDPRYKSDPAFRDQVLKKSINSKF